MAGIYKRGKTWWGRIQRDGKEYRRSLETRSESVARQRLTKWTGELEAIAWGQKPRLTLNAVAERFINEHLINLRIQSARRYGVSIQWLDQKLGSLYLDQISSAELVEFETWRRTGAASAPTIRRDLACLSSLFSFAQERELIDTNPVPLFLKRAKRRGLRESASRKRYLSQDEELKLLSQCSEQLKVAVTFAIYSGLRQREQFDLLWSAVDLAHQPVLTISAEAAKSKRSRKVVLLAPAANLLRSLPKHIRTQLVFWHRGGTRVRHLNRSFQSAAKRAEIRDIQWHDLRRTHGCRLIQDHGWSLEMVKEQLGHSSVVVTEKAYAFLEIEQRIAKVWSKSTAV